MTSTTDHREIARVLRDIALLVENEMAFVELDSVEPLPDADPRVRRTRLWKMTAVVGKDQR